MKRSLLTLRFLLGSVLASFALAGCGVDPDHPGFNFSIGHPIPGGATGYSEALVVDHGGTVAVVDVTTNQIVRTIPVGTNPGAGISLLDGRATYFPDTGGISKVGVLDGTTGERLEAVTIGDPTPTGNGTSAGRGVVAMDGKLLYVTSDPVDFTVAAIDTTINQVGQAGHGKDLKKIPVSGAPLALATNRSGTRVYVLVRGTNGAAIDVIDASVPAVVDQRVIESFPLPPSSGWQSLVANISDDELYFTSADGIGVIDVTAGSPTRGQLVARVTGVDAGEMATDGSTRLYALTDGGTHLLIVDIAAGSANRHIPIGGFSVSPAGYVAYDVQTGTIYLASANDRTLTGWQLDPQRPDTFVRGATLALPHAPHGLGLRPTGAADRLYVSMGAEGPAQVNMFDGVFPPQSWTSSKVYDTTVSAGALFTIQRPTSGGLPANFRQTTHQWTGGSAASLGLEVAHVRSFSTHDSRLAGGIDHVDISFDAILLSQQGGTPGVAIFPLLVQHDPVSGRDQYYQFYDAGSPTAWTHKEFRGLTAADFTNAAVGGPLHPDFSTGGAPITFGYGTANGSGTPVAMTTVSGIDNWNVVLTLR